MRSPANPSRIVFLPPISSIRKTEQTVLPPRPDLDPEIPRETPGGHINNVLLAAVDLRLSAHFRLQELILVADFRGNKEYPPPCWISLLISDLRDAVNRANQFCCRIRPYPEDDTLPGFHVCDLLLRDHDLGVQCLDLLNDRYCLAFFHALADFFLQMPGRNHAGDGA